MSALAQPSLGAQEHDTPSTSIAPVEPGAAPDPGRYWLVYDGQCAFCLVAVQWVKLMDYSDSIAPVDSHRIAQQVIERVPTLDPAALMQEAYLITPDNRVFAGFAAFRRLAWLLPALWPIVPLSYAPGACEIGQSAYKWIAAHRHELMPCTPEGSCTAR